MTASNRLHAVLLAIVALPLFVLLLLAGVVVGGQIVGVHPFWPTPDLDMVNYAALTDTADVQRLILAGADPNQTAFVRPEYLRDWRGSGVDGMDRALTEAGMPLFAPDGMYRPLRVAVIVRQPRLVQTLIRAGATLPPAERTAAICFAAFLNDTPIVESLLATGDRSDPRSSCPKAAEEQ